MHGSLWRIGCGAALGLLLHAAQAADPAATSPLTPATTRTALPLWEVGIAAAAAGSPDYPGSDRVRARVLPLPYGIYRGKTLFAGEQDAPNFSPTAELDLSLGGALPADSDGSSVRTAMPDLDLLLEVGPQLSLLLARPTRNTAITLALPMRAVVSTDFDRLRARGLLFAPELSYTNGKFARRGWSTRVSLATSFANEMLADYFYEVAPRYAQAGRPAYDAGGGLLETSLTTVVSRSFINDVGLFAFVRLASLKGSANTESPLLRDPTNLSFGIGLAFTFLRSDQTLSDEE